MEFLSLLTSDFAFVTSSHLCSKLGQVIFRSIKMLRGSQRFVRRRERQRISERSYLLPTSSVIRVQVTRTNFIRFERGLNPFVLSCLGEGAFESRYAVCDSADPQISRVSPLFAKSRFQRSSESSPRYKLRQPSEP